MSTHSATLGAATVKKDYSSYRFLIEGLLFFSYFVFGLSWIGYSPFLGEITTQFGLTHASAGMIISSVSFAKIFIPFVAGILVLRYGVNRTLLAGMVCICASLLSPFMNDYYALIATRIVFGVGGAVVITLIGSAIMQWFPKEELPVVNGFNYVAVNSGITLSLFITPPLAASFGRTSTLMTYALISLAITVGWLLFGKDRQPFVRKDAGADKKGGTLARYGEIIRSKDVWWLTLAAAGPLSLYLVFNTWLPTFYGEMFGMERAQAARLTGLANMVGIPTAIIGGLLTKRLAARKPLIMIASVLMGVAAFGLFLTSNMLLLQVSAVFFGIGLFLWISPLTTLGMELPGMTPEKLAMLNGVYYGIGYICAFLAPIITGALRDQTGSFIPGFVIFAISAWSLFLGGVMLPETGKAKKKA
ncbi:MAG: MFS transporter [Oligoflexia bacterium]|nr:MFS transporter [Oligoflexia bacterium]